ncbi:oxidoreductase domain protein [Formosa agariphila KMM 3901]|uniref:Oxidoreductase domain protein n=1 Tax=Formosa agariphila (strain DSM 15362 / KCTC 12365 / LMG 23005 / KMM 3901 / M-2Alg 35-1) TaxID=1347342 RepID=T2KJ40_FORAG|nr:Gfo/Idh/MocA family oxidoreductase [Formosa agariphila]CDF78897.1 oxidoreductase domain protein [Formosa agariphila KMM 3901]
MTAKKIYNIAIIGSGSIAKTHAKCINDLSNTKLIAVCTSSESRIQQAEANFNVPVYTDYNTLFNENLIDIVSICTQSGSHLESTRAAAQAGIHVLCEKPLEISVKRATAMIEACKTHNVKLSCVFQNRYATDYKTVLEAIHKGWLGKLLMGNASINWNRSPEYYSESVWRGTLLGDGGAALINQGIHTIDLLINAMGAVHSVFGKTYTKMHNIEGEDLAHALVNFKNGAIGTITAGTALYPGNPERLEIYGEHGTIILEGGKIIKWDIKNHDRNPKQTDLDASSGASDPLAIGHALHKTQISEFIKAISNNTQPEIDGEEGLKSLALIEGIYKSSTTHSEVIFS